MVVLPDKAAFEMTWKQVKYINHDNFIVFQIIPMLQRKDFIVVPKKERWEFIKNVFSFKEREEILFLLERIKWRRDISIFEADIDPYINKDLDIREGMIEATEGYGILTKKNLFDVDSKLEKEQVKELYCKLEERFADEAKGIVYIPQNTLIKGSIIYEISIPVLKRNPNVELRIV